AGGGAMSRFADGNREWGIGNRQKPGARPFAPGITDKVSNRDETRFTRFPIPHSRLPDFKA
ncbi:hypothetical protein AB4084_41720, partial [Lysobacter sp. 2RAB21]